ncbi:MAG: YbhB/YbcL family Raf kinase inhibitor-like protein [Haloarculaceae archaeon]
MRRRAVLTALAALTGCQGLNGGGTGTPTPSADNPAVGDAAQTGDLELTSPAFGDGERIPEKYGHDAENVNPPLSISGVPSDASSLVLIVDDPDAVEPAGEVWLHWLVWNIPASRTEIPEGWNPSEAVQGKNDFGNRRYGGPAPPDEAHTYRFKLYALDATLDLPASAGKREVGRAMEGQVVAQTQLEGTYAP